MEKLPNVTRSVILPDGYKDVSEMEQEKLTEYISKIDSHILVGI